MDEQRFDNLTRALARGASRRGVLKGLAASVAGLVGVGAVRPHDAGACTPDRYTCRDDDDCCSGVCRNWVCQEGAGGGATTDCAADLRRDPANCGTCGNVCGTNEICANGLCRDCGPWMAPCNGYCYGACPEGQQFNDDCTCTCPAGLTDCGGQCVDTTSDSANCGACGNGCPAPTDVCRAAATCTAGVCGYQAAPPETACRTASCADGIAILAATCGGATTCPLVQHQSCELFTCDDTGTACRETCANEGDVGCIPGAHCDDRACVPDEGLGATCDETSDCETGLYCVDGVCCNAACTRQCEACNAQGVCSPVTGPPVGGRAACGGEGDCAGTCDGNDRTACVFPDSTTSCAASTCVDGMQTDFACDGAGACAESTTGCGHFLCNDAGTACRTDCEEDGDSGCAAGAHCDGGDCVPDLAPGADCDEASDCASGHCVGGTCCEQACDAPANATSTCDDGQTCGFVCTAGDPCDDTCCAAGEECIDDACCAEERTCQQLLEEPVCCPSDEVCVPNALNDELGQCCRPANRCGDHICCADGEVCISSSNCCPETQACSTGGCCPEGHACVQQGTSCCPFSRTCGDECCAAGDTCVDGVCCPGTQYCGPVTQLGIDEFCCPNGSTCTVLVSGDQTSVLGVDCCHDDECIDCCTGDEQCIDGECCPAARQCGKVCCRADQNCEDEFAPDFFFCRASVGGACNERFVEVCNAEGTCSENTIDACVNGALCTPRASGEGFVCCDGCTGIIEAGGCTGEVCGAENTCESGNLPNDTQCQAGVNQAGICQSGQCVNGCPECQQPSGDGTTCVAATGDSDCDIKNTVSPDLCRTDYRCEGGACISDPVCPEGASCTVNADSTVTCGEVIDLQDYDKYYGAFGRCGEDAGETLCDDNETCCRNGEGCFVDIISGEYFCCTAVIIGGERRCDPFA